MYGSVTQSRGSGLRVWNHGLGPRACSGLEFAGFRAAIGDHMGSHVGVEGCT